MQTRTSKGRRWARIVALQAIHESDAVDHVPEQVLARRAEEESLAKPEAEFALGLVNGVVENREEIDGVVAEFAPEWPIGQMGAVDRGILSLAVFELRLSEGTPPGVVINEAVELANIFGSESSPRFVNGVLGSLMRAHDGPHSGKIATSNTKEVA